MKTNRKNEVFSFLQDLYFVAIGVETKRKYVPLRTHIICSISLTIFLTFFIYKLWEGSFIWAGIQYLLLILKKDFTWYDEIPQERFNNLTLLSKGLIEALNDMPSSLMGYKFAFLVYNVLFVLKIFKIYFKAIITLFKSTINSFEEETS